MNATEFWKALTDRRKVEVTVRGRRTGRPISAPVWFVEEDAKLYLLPVNGSRTNWFRNVQNDSAMTLSTSASRATVNAKPILEENLVKKIAEMFRAKYGADEIGKWYSGLDVCVEIAL